MAFAHGGKLGRMLSVLKGTFGTIAMAGLITVATAATAATVLSPSAQLKPEGGRYKILGFDAAGVVKAVGSDARLSRDGVAERLDKFLAIKGTRSPDSFHKELGRLMWDD